MKINNKFQIYKMKNNDISIKYSLNHISEQTPILDSKDQITGIDDLSNTLIAHLRVGKEGGCSRAGRCSRDLHPRVPTQESRPVQKSGDRRHNVSPRSRPISRKCVFFVKPFGSKACFFD